MDAVELLGFLILFPLVVGLLLFAVRADGARNVIVIGSSAVIALASIVMAFMHMGTQPVFFEFSSVAIDYVCLAITVLIGLVIIGYAIKYKNVLAGALGVVQLVASIVFEVVFAHGVEVTHALYYDSFSLIMALIIGVIGTGICVYALGYMQDFQAHEPEGAKDRRPFFFGIMFIFLSAMYVIVFADNMSWMFTGWEVTTLCSFLLIGFTRTEEAIANSFRQIIMNIAGGIGFVAALYFCVLGMPAPTLSLVDFVNYGISNPAIVAFPLTALAFAGITKAAQMPFHTWLLGAMVAPTPTSALLHSSTMVKAGVFLLVKLAPLFMLSTYPQIMVVLVGGITFMLASFMAISQSNAKRVLAYSTIANLGLIVACAGVGTQEAVWAAIFLIVFHAIAKSLLFLCVGTAEHHIGSRDIEAMDLLFERMPRLARLMMLGIMAMFIAPFGMLISKWATLVSFIEMNQVALIILLAFGSAATFMFWAKWMGKLAGIAGQPENVETTVHGTEWIATYLMAGLIVLHTALLPLVSSFFVMPYLEGVYSNPAPAIGNDILWITSILSVIVVVILFGGLGSKPKNTKQVDVYLAGISLDNSKRAFQNAFSKQEFASSRNMYLDGIFGESSLRPIGEISTALIIIAGFVMAIIGSVAL